jgi:hypothetical protein
MLIYHAFKYEHLQVSDLAKVLKQKTVFDCNIHNKNKMCEISGSHGGEYEV